MIKTEYEYCPSKGEVTLPRRDNEQEAYRCMHWLRKVKKFYRSNRDQGQRLTVTAQFHRNADGEGRLREKNSFDHYVPARVFHNGGRNKNKKKEVRFTLKQGEERENTEREKDDKISRFNKKAQSRTFSVGDLVYLKDMSSMIGTSKKLAKPWKRPYTVIDVVGPMTYRIRKVGTWKEQVVHVNRLKQYRRQYEENEEETSEDSEIDEQLSNNSSSDEGNKTRMDRKIVLPPYREAMKNEEEDKERR